MAVSFDLADRLIKYESGDASKEETLELFQHLVDTGMAWTMQGRYGRTAFDLLERGLIHSPTYQRGGKDAVQDTD